MTLLKINNTRGFFWLLLPIRNVWVSVKRGDQQNCQADVKDLTFRILVKEAGLCHKQWTCHAEFIPRDRFSSISCSNFDCRTKARATMQRGPQAPSETEELTLLPPLPKAFDCLWHHELPPGQLCFQWVVSYLESTTGAARVKVRVVPRCSSR